MPAWRVFVAVAAAVVLLLVAMLLAPSDEPWVPGVERDDVHVPEVDQARTSNVGEVEGFAFLIGE